MIDGMIDGKTKVYVETDEMTDAMDDDHENDHENVTGTEEEDISEIERIGGDDSKIPAHLYFPIAQAIGYSI
jgi:hypothetical protein